MVYGSGHLCPDPTDEGRRQLYPWRVFSSRLGLSLLPSEISVNIKHLLHSNNTQLEHQFFLWVSIVDKEKCPIEYNAGYS